MLFENGILKLDSIQDKRAVAVLERAIDRAAGKIRPSDLLCAAIAQADAAVLSSLSQALEPGATPLDLMEVIQAYNPARTSASEFDGSREFFSAEALQALNDFDA